MAVLTAFLDANVLYPAALRNLLMHLSVAGLFRARWSNAVHEEWISNLLEHRPDLTRKKLERTRQLMDAAAFDAVVSGYEDLMPRIVLPDKKDRHVLAAAIRGSAQVIVTRNLKDFPGSVLQRFGMEAISPDDFVMRLIEAAPEVAKQAAETHRTSLKNPPKTREEYLASLAAQFLPRTSEALGMLLDG